MARKELASPARGLVWALCLAGAAGCTVGPDYRPPSARAPAQWASPTSAPASQPAPAAADLVQWWTTFGDPTLTSLVDRAVQSNLDLKQAAARLRQARAVRSGAVAGLGPTALATAAYSRSRLPVAGGAVSRNQYQAGLDAAWELDLFGGIRRSVEAADADVQAATWDQRAIWVSVSAEVALNYISLRTSQQRIAIANRNLETQRHSAELTRKRFQGGLVGGLDVANADALVATTSSQIPPLEALAQQSIYSLGVLLGREPDALLAELLPASVIPAGPPAAPVGVPSELLRRRPDIRSAEDRIHSATARIGVATADLFPKVAISGALNFQGSAWHSWLDWANRAWSFGPSVSWQVFDSGRIRSNIEIQKALQEQSFLTYEQTVLTAFLEVETAMIASTKEQEHRQALENVVAANRKTVDLATQLYTQGQTDFLSVLDAQRSLYASEDALVQSVAAISTDLVTLYKALGGGWEEKEQKQPSPASQPAPTTQPATAPATAPADAAAASRHPD